MAVKSFAEDVLKTNFRRRGFRLFKNRQQVFKTEKYDREFYHSSASIHGDKYEIRQNEDRLNIYKNDIKISLLDLLRKPYSVIILQRTDGSKDFFKLKSTHMSHYTLFLCERGMSFWFLISYGLKCFSLMSLK